ncbi:MAG: hypothetical protein ABIB47_05645 [Candidatus Woesearchaeota archaeon]
MDLKSDYEKLSKKYDLPDYEELDNYFEFLYFQKLIEIKFPLRFVRRRIFDKVNSYIGFLQNIISPNPQSLISLEESKFFTEEEKNEMIILLKDMMRLERKNLLMDLQSSEDEQAEFIKEAYAAWKGYKDKIYALSEKLKDTWSSETKAEKRSSIFG